MSEINRINNLTPHPRLTPPDIDQALNKLDNYNRIGIHSRIFNRVMQNSVLLELELASDPELIKALMEESHE